MVFSLWHLQEKCGEQLQIPSSVNVIDLKRRLNWSVETATGRFSQRLVAHPYCRVLSSPSTYTDTQGTVKCNGSSAEPFGIRIGVKQGQPHSRSSAMWPYLCSAVETRLRHSNRSNLPSYPIRCQALQPQEELLSLVDCFAHTCKEFTLIISLKKTTLLGQDAKAPPVITIDDYERDAVYQFTYLGSTISGNLSLSLSISLSLYLSLSLSLWTQRSARGSHGSHRSRVDTPKVVDEDKYDSVQCMLHRVYTVMFVFDYSCMAAKRGQHVPGRREG